MTDDEHCAQWSRYAMADDPTLLPRLAELVGVPTPPRFTWRAATITLFATDPNDNTGAYLQFIQDLHWPIDENALLQLAITLLRYRTGAVPPDPQS